MAKNYLENLFYLLLVAYFTPIIVPTIEKALVKSIPKILLHVEPIIWVSLSKYNENPYIIVVANPTPIII